MNKQEFIAYVRIDLKPAFYDKNVGDKNSALLEDYASQIGSINIKDYNKHKDIFEAMLFH